MKTAPCSSISLPASLMRATESCVSDANCNGTHPSRTLRLRAGNMRRGAAASTEATKGWTHWQASNRACQNGTAATGSCIAAGTLKSREQQSSPGFHHLQGVTRWCSLFTRDRAEALQAFVDRLGSHRVPCRGQEEFVVVDNGSTDETAERLTHIAATSNIESRP